MKYRLEYNPPDKGDMWITINIFNNLKDAKIRAAYYYNSRLLTGMPLRKYRVVEIQEHVICNIG